MPGKKIGFFKQSTNVGQAIVDNFTQAMTVRDFKNKSGSNYPKFNCSQRKDLDEKLAKLGADHSLSVGDINQGHDMAKTPLDKGAKKTLLQQAKQNDQLGLSPFMAHAFTQRQEVNNSHAFFRAAKISHGSENIAGGLIHFGKSIMDGISQEMLPCDEYKVTFSNK